MPLRASFCESFPSHSQSGSLTPRSWNRDTSGVIGIFPQT